MTPRRRKRLDPSVFSLPVEAIREGAFAGRQAARTRELLRSGDSSPSVILQVACTSAAVLAGIDEAVAILKLGAEDWSSLVVHALFEGDRVEPWEAVLQIEGPYEAVAHLEPLCVSVLARRTRIATGIRALVEAARPRPIFLLGSRHDHWSLQPGDGYAAAVAGVGAVSGEAQGAWWPGPVVAAVPHALIAACGGDTVAATLSFAEGIAAETRLLAPADYENDAVRTSVELARALEGRIWGVQLDTPAQLVDRSIIDRMGTFAPAGVNAQLVWNVRNALDAEGFGHVRIVVSSGVEIERVRVDVEEGVPVDAYALWGVTAGDPRIELMADVVQVNGVPQARAGRGARPLGRLERVK